MNEYAQSFETAKGAKGAKKAHTPKGAGILRLKGLFAINLSGAESLPLWAQPKAAPVSGFARHGRVRLTTALSSSRSLRSLRFQIMHPYLIVGAWNRVHGESI